MEGMLSPAAGNNGGLAKPLLANDNGKAGRAGGISEDKYWVPVDEEEEEEEEVLAAEEDGGKDCRRRPLLYRTFKVKGILLQTYRYVIMGLILLVIKLSGVSSDDLFINRNSQPISRSFRGNVHFTMLTIKML